jgi:transcriptional regulator with XRE-family HTH domain
MQNFGAGETTSEGESARDTPKDKVTHPEFAYRLGVACETHPHCPPPNHGRLGWIRDQLKVRFEQSVTNESVRRWLAGEARPRVGTLAHLAEILQVEEAWLSVGTTQENAKELRAAQVVEKGAAMVLAGLVQMSGGSPAFPSDEDARAKQEGVDLYAIIRGAQYAFHVSAGLTKDNEVTFNVPVESKKLVVLGAILRDDLTLEFYELPTEVIESFPVKSGSHQVSVRADLEGTGLRRVNTLSERI